MRTCEHESSKVAKIATAMQLEQGDIQAAL